MLHYDDLLPLCTMSATLIVKLHGVLTVQERHPVLEDCCLASSVQAMYCGLFDFYICYFHIDT